MKLLKVLNKTRSPYQNMPYMLGITYTCDDFCANENKDCAPGFYAVDWDGLSYAYRKGRAVYECEVSGKKVEYNQFKRRYEKIKIVRKLSLQEIKNGLKKASTKAGYDLYHVSFPVNPLHGKAKSVTQKEIDLMRKWDSVRASVRDSVWASVRASVGASVRDSVWASVGDSVWASVRASVRDSVWASVRASVRDSVWASVRAYISSLFPNVKEWKYIDHEAGINPFQPCIDLWLSGFVPSFDGTTWRLHSGKKATVVYEIDDKEWGGKSC